MGRVGTGNVTTSVNGNGLLRSHDEGDQPVTTTELFFDLVYVFAVTQLSHLLLGHLTALGLAQTLLLLLAIWRAWIDTAWVTNWFDPDQLPVRFLLLAGMLLSLIMSAALPEAFGPRGWIFAVAYVAVQIGRTSFVIANLDPKTPLGRNFQRILVWFVASGVLWLAGGFVEGTARDVLWLAAVGVDWAAPASGFVTPGLGRSRTTDFPLMGAYFAERCQLFILIALGESILVTGASLGAMSWSVGRVGACVVAFVGTVALWWIYFDHSADLGRDMIASASDTGRLGRSAYTYFHVPMVAGIILTAVANDLVIAHPGRHTGAMDTLVIIGGPALYVVGHTLFKSALTGRFFPSRAVAIAALGVLIPLGAVPPLLVLAALVSLVLVALAAWETHIVRRAAHLEHESQPETAAPLEPSQAPE